MYRRLQILSAAIIALPMLIGNGAIARAADDERPDLKIEVVSASERDLSLKITNVSIWWADATTAHVSAVSPAAARIRDVRVENLDPGQSQTFSIGLPAGCQPQVVRADVDAAGNYEGKKESNLDNNRVEVRMCGGSAPQAPVVVPGVKTGPPPDVAAAPELAGTKTFVDVNAHGRDILAPKVITTTVQASVADSVYRARRDSGESNGLMVGYMQYHAAGDDDDHNDWFVAQTAVNFDLAMLQKVPGTTVREAVLRYTESYEDWREPNGRARTIGNCVEGLGRATEEWQNRSSSTVWTHFPNDKVQGHTPGVREWFVTSEIRDQWIDNQYPPLGFVLRGGNEAPDGSSQLSCVSKIDNLTLEITYAVPQ